MKIFAISDLHLSFGANKPMDIFGKNWENYLDIIVEDWNAKVSDDDVVLVAGDISWAMKLDDTKLDFEFLGKLKGKIFIIKGNHDYWWNSVSAVRRVLPPNVTAIQNDAFKVGDYIICGTRGWTVPEDGATQTAEDKKIFLREGIRLDLTLNAAKNLQKNGEKIIVMMHYPPVNSRRSDSDFSRLLEKYDVSAVVYGHLHGSNIRKDLIFEKNGVKYFLTSCDQLGNKLCIIS